LEGNIKTYKRKFDRDLKHIKIILTHARHRMPVSEWLRLVHETRDSILDYPEEYFCGELPPRRVFREAIEKVFEGFLEDQRLLALQTSKGFRLPRKK